MSSIGGAKKLTRMVTLLFSEGDRVFVYVKEETHDSLRKATVIGHQPGEKLAVRVRYDTPTFDGVLITSCSEASIFPITKDMA